MKSRNVRLITILILLVTFTIALGGVSAQSETPEVTPEPTAEPTPPGPFRVVGLYSSYDIYERQYFITDIPADKLTHLVYGPMAISENGQCMSSDEWADTGFPYPEDEETERLKGNFKQLGLLKAEHPELQIIMSIGGWDFSGLFSDVSATEEARVRFVNSCVSFMQDHGFDGINIEWRYPIVGGKEGNISRPEDGNNLALLLDAMRTQLDAAGLEATRTYLLTTTLPAVPENLDPLPLRNLHRSVDWINVTTYGFQGSWSELASHAAPLMPNTRDPRGEGVYGRYNVAATIDEYLNSGVPAEKIVMGIPFYAQTWRNVRPNDYFGLYSVAEGVPNGTRPGGLLYYSDLESLLESPNYTRFFDPETSAAWMYSESQRVAISYENEQSIAAKTDYVRQFGLGGVMVDELAYDNDDATLLNNVYNDLNGAVAP
jgi:chitinase